MGIIVAKLVREITARKWLSVVVIGLTSLVVAVADYFTPPEVFADTFYALPILLGVAVFGPTGGFFTATSSVIFFYFSSFYLAATDSTLGAVWLSLLLTYILFLGFAWFIYIFLQNQRKLLETRTVLQLRLEEVDALHQKMLTLAVLDERNRIARDIHDVLAQGFAAILVQVEAAELNQTNLPELKKWLAEIEKTARYNLQEARHSVADLRPLPLDGKSLVEALADKVAGFKPMSRSEITFAWSGELHRLSAEVETTLFRVAQEALNNAIRYSTASKIIVTLDYDEDEVCLTVEDNGKGFDYRAMVENNQYSFGLRMMQERAGLVDGWVSIQSQPGTGCRVRAIVPYSVEK